MGMDGILAGYIYIDCGFWFFKAILIDFLVCHHIKKTDYYLRSGATVWKESKGPGSFLGRVGRAIDW